MNAYETLGLSTTSTEAQVRKAYRKMAMKYHPDRGAGSDEAKFKAAKEAFETIEKNGFRPPKSEAPSGFGSGPTSRTWEPPRNPAGTWRDKPDDINEIFEEMRRANRNAARTGMWAEPQDGSELVARVSLREAFNGFNMVVPKRQRGGMITNVSVHIPGGQPDGYRGRYPTNDGGLATIITRIDAGRFSLRGMSDQDNLFSAGLRIGDIEIEMEVDALDLITGTWIKTEDFLGEKLDVRVPEGFNPLHRLKIAGKGYYGWLQEYGRASNNRMDMFIKIKPIFRKPADIEAQKIVDLYNSVRNAGG